MRFALLLALGAALASVANAGCCSWDGGNSCGDTTDYCKSSQAHCENDCNGKWIGGGPSPTPPSPPSPSRPHKEYCPNPAIDFQEEVEGPPGSVTWTSSGWSIQGQRRVSSKASFDFRGGYLEFDMDLSNAHGGVNTNFYLTFPHKENCGINCYCDSGATGGCSEIDITENNGNCWAATTWHNEPNGGDKAGHGGQGGIASQIHIRAEWDQEGNSLGVTVGGNHYQDSGLADQLAQWGAAIYSSQWVGWVPGNCPGDSNLQASSYSVSNMKLQASVVQGPAPQECGRPGPAPPAPPAPVAPTPAPQTGTPVERYGHLQVKGNKVVDKTGQPVRLQGMSLFWSQWMGKYWNKDAIKWMRDDWKVEVIRAAMGVDQGGYLENQGAEKGKLEAVVDACIDLGIYVIIDWHLEASDAHLDQAKAFFGEMAQKYGSHPNVLFEDWNEPKNVDWGQVKSYHEQVVPVIRQHSNNVVILGTPTWSQDVDIASQNPVSGDNLAYTCHFYAASHGQGNRDKVQTALNNGVAVFVTEWGTCEASGNGRLDLGEVNNWMSFLEQNHISSTNWAVSDKAESCSALQGGASGSGGWSQGQLSESGNFVRNLIRGGGAGPGPGPGPGPSPGADCDCGWTHGGSSCGGDDGSHCWKVCCGGGLQSVVVV